MSKMSGSPLYYTVSPVGVFFLHTFPLFTNIVILYSIFAIERYISLYISPRFLLYVDLFSSGSCWMIACLLYFIFFVDPLFSSLNGPRLLYFHLGDRVYVQHQFPSNTSRCPPQNYKLIAV